MGCCGVTKRSGTIITMNGENKQKIIVNPSQFVLESHNKFSQVYKIDKRIGAGIITPHKFIGAYGDVFVCYHRQTGQERAVKVLFKSAFDEAETKRFHGEIDILKRMDHQNIVKLYEVFEDSKRYYLITEYSVYYIIVDFVKGENYLIN